MLATFVKSRAQLALVYISGSFGFGFQQMAAFLVPLRARELSAPLDQIGIIVGAGAIVPALLSVWSGELADRFGARRTYIGGTIVAAACGVLMFAATSYWLLLPIQLVMGFARSTAWIASQTYVANIGTGEDRAKHMGRLSFTTNAGTVVAPLVIGQVGARGIPAGPADRHRSRDQPAAADGQRELEGTPGSARSGAGDANEHESGSRRASAAQRGRGGRAVRYPDRAPRQRRFLAQRARWCDGPVCVTQPPIARRPC